MAPPELAKRLGIGVLVFALVVAGGVVTAGGSNPEAPAVTSMTYAAYEDEDTLASVPDAAGEVSLSADATGKVVLIDASRGNAIDREQLAPLVTALTRNGAEVRFLTGEGGRPARPGEPSAFNASLREADAFVTFGPERAYTASELDGLEAFADAGGRLLVVNEPAEMQPRFFIFGPPRRSSSAAVPLTALGSRFGISYGNGYLYNMERYDTNYRNVYAVPADAGPLTAGVDRLVLHEAVPVQGPTTVLATTEGTELSETRAAGEYGVVVRAGNVIAVGDASMFGQDFYQRADNEVFVGNVLDFLVSGEKVPENAPAPPETEGEARPPR